MICYLLNQQHKNKYSFRIKLTANEEMLLGEDLLTISCVDMKNPEEKINCSIKYMNNGIYEITVDRVESNLNIEIVTFENNLFGRVKLYVDEEEYIQRCEELDCKIGFYNIYRGCNFIYDDMLSEDGIFTIEGMVRTWPESFKINNEDVYINPETMEFSYDVKVKKGRTFIKTEVVFNGKCTSEVYTLDYDKVKIELDGLNNSGDLCNTNDEMVIYSNDENFKLAGVIRSTFSINSIDINGDNVYVNSDDRMARDGSELEQKFDYNIKLNKGKNVITFNVKYMYGLEEVRTIIVNY